MGGDVEVECGCRMQDVGGRMQNVECGWEDGK